MSKYIQGDLITSIQEFTNQDFIILKGKVYHRGFTYGWALGFVIQTLAAGGFYKAIKQEEKK